MNFQTLTDIGPYQYADNAIYNFQVNSYDYYFKHSLYRDISIDSLSNACNVSDIKFFN